MLNWNTVLTYVKGRLALPSTFIEKADDEIKNWIIITSLKEFSEYIPDINWVSVDPQNTNYRADRQNEYYFWDDEDLDILGARNYYFGGTGQFAVGQPYTSPTTFSGMKDFALAAFKANMLKPYSWWGFTCKFIRPNIIRVLPAPQEAFVVEYEREHPHDLRTIPSEHSRAFMDLCLAETQLWLGSLRSHYGDGRVQTPWGEIPLNGDSMKQEGNDLRREVVERLRDVSLPGVIVDIQ